MADIIQAPKDATYLSLVKDKGDGEFSVLATFNLNHCGMPQRHFNDVIKPFIKALDGEVLLLERQDTPDTIMDDTY